MRADVAAWPTTWWGTCGARCCCCSARSARSSRSPASTWRTSRSSGPRRRRGARASAWPSARRAGGSPPGCSWRACCSRGSGARPASASRSWLLAGLKALAPASTPRLADAALDARVLAFALLVTVATGVLFGLAAARAGVAGPARRGAADRRAAALLAFRPALARRPAHRGGGPRARAARGGDARRPERGPPQRGGPRLRNGPGRGRASQPAPGPVPRRRPPPRLLRGAGAASRRAARGRSGRLRQPPAAPGRLGHGDRDRARRGRRHRPAPRHRCPGGEPGLLPGRSASRSCAGGASSETDREGAPYVGLVNQDFERVLFAGESVLGRRFRRGNAGSVGHGGGRRGLAAAGRASVGAARPRSTSRPRRPGSTRCRSPTSPCAARAAPTPRRPSCGAEVTALDPEQPVSRVMALDDALARDLAPRRFGLAVLAGFALRRWP